MKRTLMNVLQAPACMASAGMALTHTFVTVILAIRVLTVMSILMTANPGRFYFTCLDMLYLELIVTHFA